MIGKRKAEIWVSGMWVLGEPEEKPGGRRLVKIREYDSSLPPVALAKGCSELGSAMRLQGIEYIFNLIIFFPLQFISLIPFSTFTHHPPPCNHNTVIHVHESFFIFIQSFHPLTSSLAPQREQLPTALYVCLSLFCLLVNFVH